MTTPPQRNPGGQVWTCDGCGKRSLWTDDHMIYGTLKDEDEGRWDRLIVTCSPECRGLGLIVDAGMSPIG